MARRLSECEADVPAGEDEDRRLVIDAAFFTTAAPKGSEERHDHIIGMRNYVLQALVLLYGREGAERFCRSYLDSRRWSDLKPVCFMDGDIPDV